LITIVILVWSRSDLTLVCTLILQADSLIYTQATTTFAFMCESERKTHLELFRKFCINRMSPFPLFGILKFVVFVVEGDEVS